MRPVDKQQLQAIMLGTVRENEATGPTTTGKVRKRDAHLLALLVLALQALPKEDHGPAGAPQRLVRRGRDDVGVVEGARHNTGSNEAADVGHVGQKVGTLVVSDLNKKAPALGKWNSLEGRNV